MSWNYRIIRKTFKMPAGKNEDEFGIYEAYYDDDNDSEKVTSLSIDPMAIHGTTLEDLEKAYEAYGLAFSRPVLILDENGRLIQ